MSSLGGEEGIDLVGLWAILQRRKTLILSVFFLVVAATAIFTYATRSIYQSSASILVTTSSAQAGRADEFPLLSDMMGATRGRSLETQIEVLKSAAVQRGALQRLPASTRVALQQRYSMTAAPVRNTDIIAVTVSSYDPKAAAEFANAVCEEYMAQNQELGSEQIRSTTKYVADQLKTVGASLDKARQDLMRFKETNGTVNLNTEAEGRITSLATTQDELRTTLAQRAASAAELGRLRQLAAAMPPTETVEGPVVTRPAVTAIQERLTQLRLERLQKLSEYTSNSPEVRDVEAAIATVEAQLRREVQTQVSSITTVANEQRRALMQDIVKLEGQIQALDARSKVLQTSVSQAQGRLSLLPKQEYRLGLLTERTAALQQTWQMLNEKYQSLRISSEARLTNARILNAAQASRNPISPRRTRNIILAVLLGSVLAISLALVIERLDNRVRSEDDAEKATGLTALAYVPFIPNAESQTLLDTLDQPTALLESHRMLRTNMAFSAIDEPIQCVAITSTQPNEGKSSSSIDLAIVMAMDGKQVILVDADLRRPSLHRMLHLQNRVGLSTVVSGKMSLEDALQETDVPGLRVLTSGPTPPNPPELLNSKAGRACIEAIREAADFVVIDTPPALIMADARIVASIAGAVLLVVAVGEATMEEIARTRYQLSQTGTRVLGIILNKITRESASYYGHYNYGYGVNNGAPAVDENPAG
jgi:capsular exopolysaccharide synthesis family protein